MILRGSDIEKKVFDPTIISLARIEAFWLFFYSFPRVNWILKSHKIFVLCGTLIKGGLANFYFFKNLCFLITVSKCMIFIQIPTIWHCSLIWNDCGLVGMSNSWYLNENHVLWDSYKKTKFLEKVEICDTTLYVSQL